MKSNYHKTQRGRGCQDIHNVFFYNNLPEPSLWNSQLGRREFLGKVGKASVGTAIVMNGFRLDLLAQSPSAPTGFHLEGLPLDGESPAGGKAVGDYTMSVRFTTTPSSGKADDVTVKIEGVAKLTSDPAAVEHKTAPASVRGKITDQGTGACTFTKLPGGTGSTITTGSWSQNIGATYKKTVTVTVPGANIITGGSIDYDVEVEYQNYDFNVLYMGLAGTDTATKAAISGDMKLETQSKNA